MASKQVSEILVRLGIQGLQGLDKLKSSFRELEKSIGPSNATIEKARRSILEFGDASNRTEQLIRGQLEAFKGLRGQAEIGSATYNKLTNSIATLEVELRGSSAAIDQQRESITRATAASERNAQALQQQIRALTELQRQARPGSSAFAQLGKDIDSAKIKLGNLNNEAAQFNRALSAGFGATPEVLGGQIATLRRGLSGLRFDSEKYLETLERIRLLSITQAGRTGRAEVIAGFQAFQSPIFQGGYADPSRLPGLPNTTAALEQQLSELAVELANVERGSAQYVEVSNRMAGIQRELRAELTGTAEAFRQLDIAQAGVERRADKIAGIQEYYRTQGPMAPGVGGYRDPVTGAMIAGGARTPGRIRVEEAAYPTPIGPQPFPEAGRRAQESIERAMDDVNRIYEDARLRRVEIQSKYDQIQIDKMLDGLELEGRVREKGFKDELAAFDRQLEARDRKRRGRLTAGQAVQAAGAAISGGIFGGPEGFLGGVGGAVAGSLIPGLGTVGGAFAGAAIGAQLGMFRQQLAAFADYAAGLQKMQIALRNAAGSQNEFDRAMAAANAATRELNVPQEVAIQGMTKLTAAVKGAGGQVSDAEVVFKNITAAIKGTGGSAQDVDGAITAMVQVFSKGKVSAEELSGQLGERLPGAVTKFAKANQMELPELQKALEQGEVGLNELMKFVVALGDEYVGVAKRIADSSQDAGARLTVAYNEMRLGVGAALQPLGALLQGAFASFLETITPALIIGAKGVAVAVTGMYEAFASGFGLIKQLGELISGLTKAFVVFGGVAAGVFVASNITTFTTAVGNLYKAFRALLSLQRLLLVVESARAAAQVLIAGLTTGATKGKILGAIVGGGTGLIAAFGIGKLIEQVVSNVTTGVEEQFKKFDLGKLTNFPSPKPTGGGDTTKPDKEAAKERKNLFQELLARIQAQNNLLTQQGRLNEIAAKTESDRAKEALKAAEEILLNQEQQLDLRFKFGEVSKDVYLKEKTAIAKQGEVIRAEFRKTAADIEEQADKIYRELFEPGGTMLPDGETPLEKALRAVSKAINDAEEKLTKLGGPAAQKGLDAIKNLDDKDKLAVATRSLLGADVKALEDEIYALTSGTGEMGTLGEIMQKHREDWEALDASQRRYIENLAAIKDGLRFAQDDRIGLGLQQGAQQYVESIGTMREATAQLAQTGIKGVEDAIFSLMTTGTANFREFAVSILRDTTRMIIQQLILRTIMQAIGAIGGGTKSSDTISQIISGGRQYTMNAKGNVYAENGIQAFAMGGIVNKPTLFKYAEGGSGRFGLMGEAGPEAIMPLKRGRDGKLGVAGGGGTSVVVNVDAKGSQVQGDTGKASQLGSALSAAVQAELIRQKRPGGLLA